MDSGERGLQCYIYVGGFKIGEGVYCLIRTFPPCTAKWGVPEKTSIDTDVNMETFHS
jgi:hypothetical protein